VFWGNGDALFDALMGAREIVVGHKLNEDTLQMSGAYDQDMIQAFFAGRSDPAFGVRICVGRPEGPLSAPSVSSILHRCEQLQPPSRIPPIPMPDSSAPQASGAVGRWAAASRSHRT
jgi:hypothetical protein